jgi:two-component system nitrogen regulation response regulator GlnG
MAVVSDDKTQTAGVSEIEAGACALMLSVLWHPQLERFGQQAPLATAGTALLVNRYTPLFGSPGSAGAALGHAGISRTPVQLLASDDGSIHLSMPAGRVHCEVNGQALESGTTLDPQRVRDGVILRLGRVMLCLHRAQTLPQLPRECATLLGISSAMVRVRRQVAVAASTDAPVLILGESGTGKELVAQAIHAGSARAHRKLVTVNMAAMSESLAAADLFGTVKGAYTGAQAARPGLWLEAHEGTLFLDEVGDAPAAVQPMLLRALETGEFRLLGDNTLRRSDVRVVAATDKWLEGSAFNQPLLRRLEGFVICTPPLRARREDIGVLVQHMLYEQGVPLDWPARLAMSVVSALCLNAWLGNVRQLAHVVRRLVINARLGEQPTMPELFGDAPPERITPAVASTAGAERSAVAKDVAVRRAYAPPASITHAALLNALDRSGWCLRTAAESLGIARPSLYNLIDRHPDIRRADAIPRDEIEAAVSAGMQSIDALAARLRTPRDALRRRLRSLGLSASCSD